MFGFRRVLRSSRDRAHTTEASLSALLLGWCLVAQGCSEPLQRSWVTVIVDADSAVRARVSDVQILVEAQQAAGDGYQPRAMRRFTPDSARDWPLQFRVQPTAADVGGTYQLTATGRNLENAIVAQARVIARLRDGQNLILQAHFETECLNRSELCKPFLTCSGGSCVAADEDPYGGSRVRTSAEPAAADGGAPPLTPGAAVAAKDGASCTGEGAPNCAGHGTRKRLVCQDSVWRLDAECDEDERCDTAIGPTLGTCQPIARECINQTPDVPFCTADEIMLVCLDLVSSEQRACAEHERCVRAGTSARWGCKPGFVDTGSGCAEATSCGTDNGGCDPLTACTPTAVARDCGPCPPSFTGDGRKGCSPLLASLVPSAGKLQPDFSPEVFEYRIQVPMLVQRLGFSATAPGMARLELNGAELAQGATGLSQVLALGTSVAELVVSTERGVPNAYRIMIERTAAQEAYLKAGSPGETDHFGYRIAADGDTLVVGGVYEDSGAGGVNGDAANNSLPNSGAAYVFVRKAGRWVAEAYLKAGDPTATAFFGVSVAISGDTLVVGCIEDDVYDATRPPTRPGSAYVFTRQGATWTQQAKLVAKGGHAGDWFGLSVAIDRDTLVVGASRGDTDVMDSGAAHVFTRSEGAWTERATLSAMMHTQNAEFGSDVKIFGDWIAVGAQEEDIGESRSGGAYVFQRSGTTGSRSSACNRRSRSKMRRSATAWRFTETRLR
jgi:hypothetical protein